MQIPRNVPIFGVVLVLGCAAFGQNNSQEKPQAALSQKEKTLLEAVSESAQWKPADPRVPKAYQNLADFYSAQGRYADSEVPYQKRLELEEDMLGRANPQIIPAVNDVARVNFAQMKYALSAEMYERSLRILERE